MPNPPLQVSRWQPSAMWSGAQQSPPRSTWQGWSAPALLSIPRVLLRNWLSLPIQGSPRSSYKWVPACKWVRWGQLNKKFLRENGESVGWCEHVHTCTFCKIISSPWLHNSRVQVCIGARRPGRPGLDTGYFCLSSSGPWFHNGACGCWWHYPCRVAPAASRK